MTVAAFHRLTIDGLVDEMRVSRWSAKATLHAPFAIEVTADALEVDPEVIVGANATLTMAVDVAEHCLGGVVDAVRLTRTGAVITIVPPVTRLSRSQNHRIVLDIDGLSLAKAVLDEHGVACRDLVANTPSARPQRVQAFESDLDFVSRLLAEEGICWLADQDGRGGTDIAIRDGRGFEPIVGAATLLYRSDSGDGSAAGEAVVKARLRRELCTDRISLRDYHFETPDVDLSCEAAVGAGALEAYAFVGPGTYVEPSAGRRLAERRLDAAQRGAVTLEATTTCHRVWPGRTFELVDAPRDDMNREWLVVDVDIEAHEHAPGDKPRFEARIRAIPANVPWRPAVTPPPSLGGVHTATVTGPAASEIHTDAHGRIKAKLRYDEDKPADDQASAWSRVVHPPTTGGFFLSRTGWEVLVAFARDSGDTPFVLGRLDNGAAPTAESLPAKQLCTNFGTPTTPGGGSANMIRLTDLAGGEDMSLVASADWDEQTAVNKSTSIKGNETKRIGANHTVNCESARGLRVDGAQTISVAASRQLTAATGIITDVSGAETVSIGGTRAFDVGGDQSTKVGGGLMRCVGGARVTVATVGNNRHVDAASTMIVGGAWIETGATAAVSVAGTSLLSCSATSIKAAKYSLEATGLAETCAARSETAASVGLKVGAGANLTFGATQIKGSTVVIKAKEITVTAGGGVLCVKSGSVTFIGPVSAAGHVRSKGDAKHG